MRTLFILIVLFCLGSKIKSQNFWAKGTGGNNVDEALGLTKDNSGNIISAGYFTNSVQLNPNGLAVNSSSFGVPDIYVQKFNSVGNLIWGINAGGTGSDRATAVKCDAAGNIYITGFYSGTATFGTHTLTSVSGSQDIFIAKLDASGNFQWAVSAGGELGDYAYGLTIDNNDNVIITGQFEGISYFGNQTLTSMINPFTGNSSFDIFTAKYNSSGTFQWVRQGQAKKNDRGMDLVSDDNGNIYVTGQFSDTITFQNTYNNPIINAVFVVKYDANGNEVWFRRAAGGFGIGYGIAIYNNQFLYVTGDFKGSMTFFGPPNNYLSDTLTNCIFLAKYNLNGNFIWAKSDASENPVSSKAVCVSDSGDVYISGEFKCVMTEYNALHGTSSFNSVGFTDVFTAKYSESGNRIWERNFGGPQRDLAHGIVIANSGRPIVAGSFERAISWPQGNSLISTSPNLANASIANQYCNDANYGSYASISAQGFSDAFVCDAIDLSREPYDFYIRNGATCDKSILDICITQYTGINCTDTILMCHPDSIRVNLNQQARSIVAPQYYFNWSGGNPLNTNPANKIYTTGNYSVELTSFDECYSFEDSVYVIVATPIGPTITDDHNFNNNQLPIARSIYFCPGDSARVTASSYSFENNIYQWGGNNYTSINDTTIIIDTTGYYNVSLTNYYGCTDSNPFFVELAYPIVANTFAIDTLFMCEDDTAHYNAYDSIQNPLGVFPYTQPYIYANQQWTCTPNTGIEIGNLPKGLGFSVKATTSGTYIINGLITSLDPDCPFTTSVVDTIYIKVHDLPDLHLSISGDPLICNGDTSTLVVSASHPFSWMNGSSDDTLLVTTTSANGAMIVFLDTLSGCIRDSIFIFNVSVKADPSIITTPGTALICPNDSVKLETTISNGINYEWHGPMGLLGNNGAICFASIPGPYHAIVTDNEACVLTSNTVEVKQYSTPYLAAEPSEVLCPGQTSAITIMTDEFSVINWQTPFSGSGLIQTVDSGGFYTCVVTSCGITTHASIQIIESDPNTTISAVGDTIFCPGDSVQLITSNANLNYTWMPNYSTTQNQTVYEPGAYYLETMDDYGCMGTSNIINIGWDTSVVPPVVTTDTVCFGSNAALVANVLNGGPIEWYNHFPSSNLLSSNDTLLIATSDSIITYYATTVNSVGCHSLWIPISPIVYQGSMAPVIIGDTIICKGSVINLSTDAISGANYLWSGPNNFSSNLQTASITNALVNHSGTYSLQTSINTCLSPVTTVSVTVKETYSVSATGPTDLCEGETAIISLVSSHNPATFNYTLNQIDSTQTNNTIVSLSNLLIGANFFNVSEYYDGCSGPTSILKIIVKPRPYLDTIISNNPVCVGDTLKLGVPNYNNAVYTWTTPTNLTNTSNEIIIENAGLSLIGNYSVYSVMDNCIGDTVSIDIVVHPLPVAALPNDTTVCSEDHFVLSATPGYFYYTWHDGTHENTITVDSSQTYSVTISDLNGCISSASIFIEVITCQPVMANVFTPNGDGVNDVFKFPGDKFKNVTCEIFDRWGKQVHSWEGVEGSWDGTNRFKMKMEEGTYYYVGKIIDFKGEAHEVKGYLSLNR
ncbi:MAG: gliding motility-associated C-terminal domain-containing protein [Bacteroidetes bacterium]|nr:gliding motility-associated C-terminal domain-containing protein [Bacteroidota bacterium]